MNFQSIFMLKPKNISTNHFSKFQYMLDFKNISIVCNDIIYKD